MLTLLIIGLVLWVTIAVLVVAALRAASLADTAAREALHELAPDAVDDAVPFTDLPGVARRRYLVVAELATLVLVVALAVQSSRAEHWQPVALTGLLAALAVAGDLQTFRGRQFRISASFPAIVVAMALLGPTPAVAIGAACALADAVLTRPRAHQLISNLLAYTAPPLLGALLLHGLAPEDDIGLAVTIMGVYLLTSTLNFVLIAGHTAALARGGLGAMVRNELLPVMPWELGAAGVAAVAVYVHDVRGAGGLAVLAVAGIAFQWLLRAVMEGQRRGGVIEHQTNELGGMVGLVLQLLAVRDPASARHAAAVAHNARLMAAAAGLSQREREVVHAAGLLHDIGRQAFADALLRPEQVVDDGGRRAIRTHPELGARLLRQVPGMWDVADAVEAHHERPDGTGYPRGLPGGRIPRAARILAVAEVYDVLTAEDSYRGAHGHEWAAAELRRVAGTQLDPRYVELFLTVVTEARRRPSLDEELPALRRARSLFGPRPAES